MSYRFRNFASHGKKPVSGALTVLGLSSLGDSLVKWREWFSTGVLQHYRDVRDWLFGWIPFDISADTKDYVIIWSASGFLAFWVLLDAERRSAPETHDSLDNLTLLTIASLLFGPLIVFTTLPLPAGPTGRLAATLRQMKEAKDAGTTIMAVRESEAEEWKARRKSLIHAVAYLVLGGTVLLIVATDFMAAS